MKAHGRDGARRRARGQDGDRPRPSGRRPTTTSSRTSRTGASRASSGGGTRSPRGTARTARSWSRASARRVHRRRELDAGPRRARHLVLERALAVLDARLARRDADALEEVLPRERSRDGLRHPLLLGRPHDDVRPPLHGRGALPPRAPLRPHRRRDRRQDEQGEGQRHRPARSRPRRRRSRTWSKKTLPGAPEAEALAKFKKAYPSAAAMGSGFPAFGADAVRFTLATYPPSNKRIALAPKRIEGNRHFLNKIWNATRLALELLGGLRVAGRARPAPTGFYNRWILSRFAAALRGRARRARRRSASTRRRTRLYRFFWNDLCDWYLELAKPRPAQAAGRRVRRARDRARDAGDARVRARGQPAPHAPADAVHHRGALAARAAARVAQGEHRLRAVPDAGRRDGRARRRRSSAWMETAAGGHLRRAHDPQRARASTRRPRCRCACARTSPRCVAFLRGHAEAIRALVKTPGRPGVRGAAAARASRGRR